MIAERMHQYNCDCGSSAHEQKACKDTEQRRVEHLEKYLLQGPLHLGIRNAARILHLAVMRSNRMTATGKFNEVMSMRQGEAQWAAKDYHDVWDACSDPQSDQARSENELFRYWCHDQVARRDPAWR